MLKPESMQARIILFFSLLISSAYAQSPLDIPITLTLEDVSIENALYEIIEVADVDLSFPNNIIPEENRVNIRVVNVPLKHVLRQIFSGTELTYRLIGQQVVILKKEPPKKEKFIISGYIRDKTSGERIIGAVIYDSVRRMGTYSNDQGFFSISLVEGESAMEFSSLGYDTDTISLQIFDNQFLEVSLSPTFLAEVVVSTRDSTLLGTNLGNLNLNLSQASNLPSLGGETDVFRLAYTLPGFQAGADGFGGISVRGGNVDQNLFLLDGVPVYNASHGIGIFSVYNSSAIRSAKVLKGAFPAKYGGRLSSVWDIQTKVGNSNTFQGELDLGLSSGTLTLEGPLNKGKGSVFFSGRRAFFDFFSEPITRRLRKDRGIDGSLGYYFYDLNFKVNHQISKKDHLLFSYYRGRDNFRDIQEQVSTFQDSLTFLLDDEEVKWGNTVASLRWNHHFSDKLFGSTSLAFSKYIYDSQDFLDLDVLVGGNSVRRSILVQKYDSEIEDRSVKIDMDYTAFDAHQIEFGGGVTLHQFSTGIISFIDSATVNAAISDTLGDWASTPVKSTEYNVYFQDEIDIKTFAKVNIGLRMSAFKTHNKWYFSPQPRLNVEIYPDDHLKIHASVNRMAQFLHLLSPSSLGLPKDLWVSSTERIPPQNAWQFQLGGERQLQHGFRLSLEGYYRKLSNLLIFKESSVEDVTSINWQNKVASGDGRAYGMELLLLQETPKFGGWIGYTLGWSDRQFAAGDVNRGNRFPIRLDRRHNVNLQFLYKFNQNWNASLGFVFSTGTAFNFPSQIYQIIQPPGSVPIGVELPEVSVFDQLNDRRMPNYHRLDIAFNRYFWQGETRHSVKLGFYNIYNRQNPLYFTLRDKFDDQGELTTEIIQVSLLPIFPTLRYTLEFR